MGIQGYILVDGKPVAVDSTTAANWFSDNPDLRAIKCTRVGKLLVSTIFLCFDHAVDGPPLLYETMVFDGETFKDFTMRYSTLEEALEGHQQIVSEITQGGAP